MSFFSELKRRNIFKVGFAYLVVGWLIIQIVGSVAGPLNFPGWVESFVIVLVGIGFPIALLFAWAYELTADGVKRTEEVDEVKVTITNKSETENTIAVLPFADMSADGSQEYFGDGMAEEILNVLVKVDALDVTSRTTAFSLKGQNLSIPVIAAQLGVNYILEGSIRSDGDTVRVTAQLIDVANDKHLWSETYDRKLTSIFAIQDEISLAIAEALKVKLLGETLGCVPTQNMEAYELYLQARQLIYSPNLENIIKMNDIAKKIIELDPLYAEGWAVLAMSYSGMREFNSQYDAAEQNRFLDLALGAANKAVTLKPELAYGWVKKGWVHVLNHQWMDAKIALEHAVKLDNKDAAVWEYLAIFYFTVGHFEAAVSASKNAFDLNPTSTDILAIHGINLVVVGEFEQSRKVIDKAIEMGFGYVHLTRALLSMTEGKKEGVAEDIRLVNQFMEYTPDENIERYVDAFFEPTLREEAKKLLPQNLSNDAMISPLGAMLLHDGDYFVDFLKINTNNWRMISTGILSPPFYPMLNQPVMKEYLRETGLVDYWQQTNWPHFCRPVGTNDFECGEFE